MTEEKDNIRKFPSREAREALKGMQPPTPPLEILPAEPRVDKLGIYPLTDDVIVSKPLFVLILTVLEDAGSTPERRAQLAQHLRTGYEAPWAPVP